jgi:hypothetical protein
MRNLNAPVAQLDRASASGAYARVYGTPLANQRVSPVRREKSDVFSDGESSDISEVFRSSSPSSCASDCANTNRETPMLSSALRRSSPRLFSGYTWSISLPRFGFVVRLSSEVRMWVERGRRRLSIFRHKKAVLKRLNILLGIER